MATKKEPTKKAPKTAAPKKPKKIAAATDAKEFTTKKFQDFTILRKRSGRFEVVAKNGKNVNGADKVKVLLDAKLIEASVPKAKEEAPPASDAPAT